MVFNISIMKKMNILNKDVMFPLVTARIKNTDFSVFELSEKLRQQGWIVPAYTLPANADDIAVMRMVVKESFSKDMIEMLITDLEKCIEELSKSHKERKKSIENKENPTLLY